MNQMTAASRPAPTIAEPKADPPNFPPEFFGTLAVVAALLVLLEVDVEVPDSVIVVVELALLDELLEVDEALEDDEPEAEEERPEPVEAMLN